MRTLTPQELEMLASQYIDGELDPTARTNFEAYVADHAEAAESVRRMAKVRSTLASKPAVEPDPWFWMKVSQRIGSLQPQSRHRTANHTSILIAGAAVLSSVIIGLVYYNNTEMFHHFFREKQSQVEQAYRSTVMTGNILPLFGNLNNDDVLNFALFGSIPIDSSNNASLKVTNTDDSGAQIQIVRSDAASAAVPVTMNLFADAIGISHHQREVVDSIIGTFKEKLKASVLVSDNERMAIHADLAEMNKTMVSTIAACLEPPQRSRFKRFLDDRHAPYAVVAVNSPTVPSHVILKTLPQLPQNNNYVVISSDTVSIETMELNLDSITEVARRQEMKFRRLFAERMMAELTERQHVLEENLSGLRENRVRVQSSSGALQIHLEHSAPSAVPGYGSVDFVRPRSTAPVSPRSRIEYMAVTGDSAAVFEMPADDRTIKVFKSLPRGEFRFEMTETPSQQPRLKVYLRSPSAPKRVEQRRSEIREPEEPLLDLDSLLRESERQPESVPVKPKKSPREMELELMM